MASVSSFSTNCVRASVRFFSDRRLSFWFWRCCWTSTGMLSPSGPPSDRVSPGRRAPGSGLLSLFSGKGKDVKLGVSIYVQMAMFPTHDSVFQEWCHWLTLRNRFSLSVPVQDGTWISHLCHKFLPKSSHAERLIISTVFHLQQHTTTHESTNLTAIHILCASVMIASKDTSILKSLMYTVTYILYCF